MLPQKNRNVRPAFGLSLNVQAILATATAIQKMLAHGINPDGSLNPEGIRSLLKLKGVSILTIASARGTSDEYVHQVINRQREDRGIEELIADRIGIPAAQIWARRANPAA